MISKCRFGTKLRLSIAILVITCSCFEHVKGSCLSYGHSCWGAHGKRGGPPKRAVAGDGPPTLPFRPQPALDQTNVLPPALAAADRWALVRILPDENAIYPFSKIMHPPPPLAAVPFLFSNDADTAEQTVPSGARETANSVSGRSADAGIDSKQTLTGSAEMELALGGERLLAASSRPAAITTNVRRRDHPRRKTPFATGTRTRYNPIDDSYDENAGADRLLVPSDEDIGQMLLLDAVAAAAVSSDGDGSIGPFSRNLLSVNAKNDSPRNA